MNAGDKNNREHPIEGGFIGPEDTPFVELHCRGELPHLYKEGCTYFVTFRLADAVEMQTRGPRGNSEKQGDAGWKPAAQEEAGRMPAPQTRKELEPEEIVARSEPPLTLGACALKRPEIARVVHNALGHFQGQRYHLHAWCIMPNHVHVVLTPQDGYGLKQILHSWKSYTANEANRILGARGTFWERESFDHAIRSPEHLESFVQYTEHNPVTAGLCARPEEWPWSSRGSGPC